MHRRNFLTSSALAGIATLPAIGGVVRRCFNIVDFGAQPGARLLNTRSLQDAIDHAFEADGGAVCVPPESFLPAASFCAAVASRYIFRRVRCCAAAPM
jgi:polygalacturonase